MPEQLLEVREEHGPKTQREQRRLVRLIYTLDSFTEEELFEELKRQAIDRELSVDLQCSLRDYLTELREVGVLRYRHGRYSVR